jgi:hypothetical protein
MYRNLRVAFVCACLVLTGTVALAAALPVAVFPNPIQFGTIPLNSPSLPLPVFLSNTSTTAVTVTSTTITGTSSGNFAFDGFSCVGTISPNQSCEMYMTFAPSAMGNATASLVIAETGVSAAITIPLQGTGGNPIPTITSLSPPTLYLNSATTTVTINGSGFLSSSTVFLQDSTTKLLTTFVSATQIKTQIPDTLLSSTGQLSLCVTNPPPGGGPAFTSVQVVAPDPGINNFSPTSIVAGTPSEPILINGQNFMSGAKVQWNGTNISTTYVSSTQLQAQPTTAELATPGIIQLTVTNPSPGTISQTATFNVTYAINITVLDLPANDLVWDPFAQVIYASLPSSEGPTGNSIAVINPSTGAVTATFFAGSEPTKLALDSTSKYLYVGLNGNGSIQRLNLPSFTPDIDIPLGNNPQSGAPNIAGAIAVSPTNSHTIATAITQNQCCGQSGTLEFFTDSAKLANSVTTEQMSQIVFASGTTLFGYIPDTLSQVAVTATGGTLTKTWNGLVTGNTFQYSGGLIFSSSGQEFNPATGLLLGTYDVAGNICCGSNPQVLSNATLNRVFALGQTPFFNSFGITSYSLSEFTPVAVANLSELDFGDNPGSTSKFMQWGTNGLAFILTAGCCGNNTGTQVVLLQSPTLLLAASKNVSPVPVLKSSSPAIATHGAGNFRLAVRGSGFSPASVVTWNGKAHSASYLSPTEMTVYVTAAAVASTGTANIAVKNPTPGGGKSNILAFTIK